MVTPAHCSKITLAQTRMCQTRPAGLLSCRPPQFTRTLPQMCKRRKLERASKTPDSALAQKCQKNHSIMHHTKGTTHSTSESPSKSKPSGVPGACRRDVCDLLVVIPPLPPLRQRYDFPDLHVKFSGRACLRHRMSNRCNGSCSIDSGS